MKRSPLVFVALTPFVAAAGGGDKLGVKHEELRDDWRVSEIIGSEVRSNDGQQYGEVEDVVLTADGHIESVLINAEELGFDRDQATYSEGAADRRTGVTAGEGDTATGTAATERGDATLTAGTTGEADTTGTAGDTGLAGTTDETGTAGTTGETGMAGTAETAGTETTGTRTADTADTTAPAGQERDTGLLGMGGDSENLVAVQWENPSFNAGENVIQLDVQPEQIQSQTVADTGAASQAGQTGQTGTAQTGEDAAMTAGAGASGQSHRVSELLDMDVRLSDEESFGSVDDILVNAEGEASALIVTSWDFLDRQQYALPVETQNINAEEGVIQYEFSSQEVEQQGEFSFEGNEGNQETS